MTSNRNFKRQVRSRAAKTGESYTAALSHIRTGSSETSPEPRALKMGVAQTAPPSDPRDAHALRRAGDELRSLMRRAGKAGARLLHFPEGATCAPHKRIMSTSGPDEIGPADWDRFNWAVLAEQLTATAALARTLRLWVVLGSVHRLTPPTRPHNSLYVISDRGNVVTRYDERLLSNTKLSYLYTPGSEPVTFSVDEVQFGCAMGMESHYPEVFTEYERLDVDCVLFSTHGAPSTTDGSFSLEVQGHASANSYWVSYSTTAQDAGTTNAPAGIVGPTGQWAGQCSIDDALSLTVVDLEPERKGHARPWRRSARSGIYETHLVQRDSRSEVRTAF